MSRARENVARALRALLEPLAEGLAELLIELRNQGLEEVSPLAAWPGTARQLRRTLERLRARGVEVATFPIGRRFYLRSRDLERLPELLGDRPDLALVEAAAPANDAHEGDVDEAGEQLAEQILAARGQKLGPAPRRRSRSGGVADERRR